MTHVAIATCQLWQRLAGTIMHQGVTGVCRVWSLEVSPRIKALRDPRDTWGVEGDFRGPS